ncbi:MAG: 1,2-phenylacetyl-CoA epoxidase subunit PaaD [Bacteroidia bacterium]|nr:phenylacetate-CoA oxygenase subunit PaaJ [Bacteroidia bacterium]MDW8157765.1 1,2-phenylacetyl-CoA epoxidase subunit PaaD [Bacteroidia bacterium]
MVNEIISKTTLLDYLQEVKDPEIPTISVVDLGIIEDVKIEAGNKVCIEMIPTFSGCPAIRFMQLEIINCLKKHGFTEVEVKVAYEKPWSSERITERGRKQLLEFGLSPPPRIKGEIEEKDLEQAICPKCLSQNTVIKNPFGPTLCRAIHYCYNCHETFEQFKPL